MEERAKGKVSPAEIPAPKAEWGQTPTDHFGYNSDEERKAKRGLEDWEMVESLPSHQRGIPKWFLAVIGFVLLIAIGLSFPFWGDRPGFERAWFDWGFVLALVYLAVAGSFVYAMVRLYGPKDISPEKFPEEFPGKKDDKASQASVSGEMSGEKRDIQD
jgi:hypothetical protein